MGQIPSIFHEVVSSHGTMTTSSLETLDSVLSDGDKLFQNSVYIGIIIEDILYGKSRDAYHEMHAHLPVRWRRRRVTPLLQDHTYLAE